MYNEYRYKRELHNHEVSMQMKKEMVLRHVKNKKFQIYTFEDLDLRLSLIPEKRIPGPLKEKWPPTFIDSKYPNLRPKEFFVKDKLPSELSSVLEALKVFGFIFQPPTVPELAII